MMIIIYVKYNMILLCYITIYYIIIIIIIVYDNDDPPAVSLFFRKIYTPTTWRRRLELLSLEPPAARLTHSGHPIPNDSTWLMKNHVQ